MKKIKIGAIIALLALSPIFSACTVTWGWEAAGTLSGTVWDVSYGYNQYTTYDVEGLAIDLYYWDGSQWVDYYDNNDWSSDAEWDYSGCSLTDSQGNFTCDFVESGEYLIVIHSNDYYYEVSYVIEVYFDDDGGVSDTGEYEDEAELDEPLGVVGDDDTSPDSTTNDYTNVKIVLSWGDETDYDSYWSFPRADYNHLQDDITSPYYPDNVNYNETTVPSFSLGTTDFNYDNYYQDTSDRNGNGPEDTSDDDGKFRWWATADTVVVSESGLSDYYDGGAYSGGKFGDVPDNTLYAIPDDAGYYDGLYGDNWSFDTIDPAEYYDDLGARGVMYWDYLSEYRADDNGDLIRIPDGDPLVYTIQISGEDVEVVKMDRDSFSGSEGPETIYLNGIPNNNWFDTNGEGANAANEFYNASTYNGGFGVTFGEGLDLEPYRVGIGQYSVVFYSQNYNDPYPASRFDSTFATCEASVSIYASDGERLWTFTIPEGSPGRDDEAGDNFFRNWRPFYGIYQVENQDGNEVIEENIKFVPNGFDNTIRYRNGVDSIVSNMGSRRTK